MQRLDDSVARAGPVAGRLQLTAAAREIVRGAVQAAVPRAVVFVFGSRATGKSRPFSDLDLLFVDPPRLQWHQRAALVDLLEASDLTFAVDIVEADALPAGMRSRVNAEAIAL